MCSPKIVRANTRFAPTTEGPKFLSNCLLLTAYSHRRLTMQELLRKAWFFGLGVLDATKEKAEALAAEMVKRGEVSQQESPQVVDQILAKAQEAQKTIVEKVKSAVADLKLVRAADLEALEKRVAALEKEIHGKSGS